MRELKFIAWHKTKKLMSLPIVLHDFFPFDIDLKFISDNEKDGAIKIESGEIIWRQFTNMHDKNGKEIYDGDIYQRLYDDRKKYPSQPMLVVEWVINRFNVRDTDNVEVIGNIYQNADLIKGGQDGN